MKRKVVQWEAYQPPVEWTPKLECGHEYPLHDYGLSDEQKSRYERDGNLIECIECSRLAAKLRDAEEEVRKLRESLERATPRHGTDKEDT